MGLQNVGTGRHENTLNLAGDMLLFTSNNVTLLVSLQQVFKMTTCTLDSSQYHSSVPTEMSGAL